MSNFGDLVRGLVSNRCNVRVSFTSFVETQDQSSILSTREAYRI